MIADLRGSVWMSIKCQQRLPRRKNGLLAVDGATAHRLPIRAKSGSLADEQSAKLPSAARPGHFLFLAKKKVTKEKGLPRQSKPKVFRATGIFRLANPWLGRKTTRIPARRPPGLQSASARILG
jgi:hypothetical protein